MSGTDYTQTPNLNLYKPIFNHAVGQWGDLWNTNADLLDAAFSGGAGGAFLPLAGGALTGGIGFGSTFAGSSTDLARHISLYGGTYGFDVTTNQLNYVAPSSAAHIFYLGTIGVGYVNATGLNMPVGQQSANGGSFTTLNVSSGLHMGAAVASGGAADLSKHIELYVGAGYGLSVTAGFLNIVAGSGAAHAFYVGTTQVGAIGTTGIMTGPAGSPTWTSGSAAPAATAPVGSIYSRVGGAVGATLYVSRGGGAWAAVAGV